MIGGFPTEFFDWLKPTKACDRSKFPPKVYDWSEYCPEACDWSKFSRESYDWSKLFTEAPDWSEFCTKAGGENGIFVSFKASGHMKKYEDKQSVEKITMKKYVGIMKEYETI